MSVENPEEHWRQLPFALAQTMIRGNQKHHPSRVVAQDLIHRVGGRILECGPGSGVDLEQLEVRGMLRNLCYHAIDLSPAILANLSARFPDVDVREGRLERIPFCDDCFDVAYTRHTVEHVISIEQVLHELTRVTKRLLIVSLFIPLNNRETRRRWRSHERSFPGGGAWYASYHREAFLGPLRMKFAHVREQLVRPWAEIKNGRLRTEDNWIVSAGDKDYVSDYYQTCLPPFLTIFEHR